MLTPGTRLEGLGIVVGRRLGQGAMGAVFEGRQEKLNRRVAVKVLLGGDAADAAARQAAERLADEARAAAAVQHPNLLRVLVVDRDPAAGLCVVYEYAAGGSLRDHLASRGGRAWPEALPDLGLPLLDGLQALHAAGVVHRDVKPENVLRDHAGTWKLGDFGLAWFEGRSAATATGWLVATPGYAAPEQLFGTAAPTPATDAFAAALLLVEATTGANPLAGADLAETVDRYRRVPLGAAELALLGVPAAACQPLARALVADPAARTASAAQLARELGGEGASALRPTVGARRVASPEPTLLVPRGAPAAPAREAARRPLARAVVPAVALLVLGLAALRSLPGPSPSTGPATRGAPAAAGTSTPLDPADLPPTVQALEALLEAFERAPAAEGRRVLARDLELSPDRTGCLRALGRELGDQAAGAPEGLDRANRLLAGVRAARVARLARAPSAPGRAEAADRLALEAWFWKRAAELAMAGHHAEPGTLDLEGTASELAIATGPAVVVTSPLSEAVLAGVALTRASAAERGTTGPFDPVVLVAALARSLPARFCPAVPEARRADLQALVASGPNVTWSGLQASWEMVDGARAQLVTLRGVDRQLQGLQGQQDSALCRMERGWWELLAACPATTAQDEIFWGRALLAETSFRLAQAHERDPRRPARRPRRDALLLRPGALALRALVDTRRQVLALSLPGAFALHSVRPLCLVRTAANLARLVVLAGVRDGLDACIRELALVGDGPEVRVVVGGLTFVRDPVAPPAPALRAAMAAAVQELIARMARLSPASRTYLDSMETAQRALEVTCAPGLLLHGTEEAGRLTAALRGHLEAALRYDMPAETRPLIEALMRSLTAPRGP